MTGLYPWLGYKATDRITVWGVAGYGAGGLLLTPEGGPALESGLSMAMAAAGTRGELPTFAWPPDQTTAASINREWRKHQR